MKTNILHRPAAALTGIAALFLIFCNVPSVNAQDTTKQKSTLRYSKHPSSVSDEQTLSISAKSDSGSPDGTFRVHIVKEKNGKKTEIDTIISSKGGLDSEEIEALVDRYQDKIKDYCEKMKDFNSKMKDFNFNFEMPDMPDMPEIRADIDRDLLNLHSYGPRVITRPGRGESLSDVLGDIPMSRVKSYKITDTKGGKHIVIDIVDGPPFQHNDDVIYINGSRHPANPAKGMRHQKDMRIIIKSDNDKGNGGESQTPAPPAEPKKSEPDSPKI